MIEKEYAIALFESSENIDETNEEFLAFTRFFNDLKDVMDNPRIKKEEKKKIIKNSFKNFSELFLHFLYVLIDNKRFSLCLKIYNEFHKLYCDKKNIATVDVYVYKELKDNERKELVNFLENKLGKEIELCEMIDEKIISGIKIVYNGKCIDYSASDRMNKMRAWL